MGRSDSFAGRVTTGVPELAVNDGPPGLHEALEKQWLKLKVQRCTVQKLRNLTAKVPAALGADYHRMTYADSRAAVEAERRRVRAKRQKLCMGVITSLDEVGEEVHFPSLPLLAVVRSAQDLRARVDRPGVPLSHQGAGVVAERGRGFPAALRVPSQGQIRLCKLAG